MEGGSPGPRSSLLHILSWIITSSQGGLRYGSYVSNTQTNWKHMGSCKHRAERSGFCYSCLIHTFMIHTVSRAAGLWRKYSRSIHTEMISRYKSLRDQRLAFCTQVCCYLSHLFQLRPDRRIKRGLLNLSAGRKQVRRANKRNGKRSASSKTRTENRLVQRKSG